MSLASAAPILALTGCATIMAGGPDHVPVITNPPGAYVYLNGVPVGQTPMELALDRGRSANIQVYLPGFAPVAMTRDKRLNGWFIVSILLFPSFVVDLVTGDYLRFEDGLVALGLVPLAAPPPAWYQPPPVDIQPATPTSQPPVVTPPAAPPPLK